VRLRATAGLTAAGVLVRLQVVWGLARSALLWLASGEEVEDTEMVHAVAPDGGICEVRISDAALARPAAADQQEMSRVAFVTAHLTSDPDAADDTSPDPWVIEAGMP
jgi:hypothetical protein